MGFPLQRCCWRIPRKGGGRVKPGSPSEVSTCYAPSVAPPDGSESSCPLDLTQFASSIFRVENSATNPDTLGAEWQRDGPGDDLRASIRPKRSSDSRR